MISAILLSGGLGTRISTTTPKQYLHLQEKPIIVHALEALLSFSFWDEICIVCEEPYYSLFRPFLDKAPILFAKPGKERQNSVFSGFQSLSSSTQFVCIHDGARPLLKEKDLFKVIETGMKTGAATLATPVKATIKEASEDFLVKKTLKRDCLWEIQTPQVIAYPLLKKGYDHAFSNHLLVTDDVGLVEALNYPVQLVPGSYSNLKITTPEDLALAHLLLKNPL